jgi:hypothetical protein
MSRIFINGITWRNELIDELERILDGNSLRATNLVEHLNWDEIVAPNYTKLKALIVENPTRKSSHKVDPAFHEDFLTISGIFFRQLRRKQAVRS